MAIFINLALAGLLLLLQDTQAKNIQAPLSANIAGDATSDSLLIEASLYNERYNTTLHFDDVPTDAETGTGTISTYSYIKFNRLNTVNTVVAASLGSISIYDADCASSQPNALFSARTQDGDKVQPNLVANTTKLHDAGLSGFFNLKGISVKLLGEVPRGLALGIVAWEIRDSEAKNVYNHWIAYTKEGHQAMYHYNLTIFGGSWGQNVNIVQILTWSLDEAKEVQWPFCLDDLEVEFLEKGSDE